MKRRDLFRPIGAAGCWDLPPLANSALRKPPGELHEGRVPLGEREARLGN